MAKRNPKKYKIDRQMGENIWGRPKSPANRRDYPPGQHGRARRRKLSDFGIQLKAKQKFKGYYGDISEQQFRNIYKEAARRRGNTAEILVALLEQRLSTIVYRAKFVSTVFAARQFVNHGHILVNGKRVDIPSYLCKPGDVIEVVKKMKNTDLIFEAQELAERDVPDYIEADKDKLQAKFLRIPALNEVPYPVIMEPALVVEFYSR